MKKILGIVLTLALLTSITSAIPVFAEKGYDGLYFYDFEDYNATEYGVLPDENWVHVNSGTKFKSTQDDDGGAMLLQNTSEPSFKFPSVLKSGKLKVSFDAKSTTEKLRMLVCFYFGANIDINAYCKPLFINLNGDRKLLHYSPLSSWTAVEHEAIDLTAWHHYEFVTSELSSSNAKLSCYVDGELLYSGVDLSGVNGIQTWSFRVETAKNVSAPAADDGFIIDNLYIDTNPSEDKYFSRTDNDRFSVDNGRISFIASEKIQGGLTKDNVTITNVLTGRTVPNFYIDNPNSQAFDIVFDGSVDSGMYNITFKNATGAVSGKTLSGTFVVQSAYKTAIIDGKEVYYPEVDNIKIYDALGNEVSESDASTVSEVRMEFNTLVSHNLDEFITVTEDGSEVTADYEVLDDLDAERSTLAINLGSIIKPFRTYKVKLTSGIPSAFSEEVTSAYEYETGEIVPNDQSFKCKDMGYDPTDKTASVIFSKQNASSGTYIYVAAGYKNVTRGGKEVRRLSEVKWAPIELKAEDKGTVECTLNLDGEADTYETFLYKFPKLQKLRCDEDGVISN